LKKTFDGTKLSYNGSIFHHMPKKIQLPKFPKEIDSTKKIIDHMSKYHSNFLRKVLNIFQNNIMTYLQNV
jgi:hypothetical protein